MKRLCVTYKMNIDHNRASDPKTHKSDNIKNCVIASFADDIAQKLISGVVPEKVKDWLNDLAELQGYKTAMFYLAEYAPACDENE